MKLSIFKSACSAIAALVVFDSTFVEAMQPDPSRNPGHSPSTSITSQVSENENYVDFCRALNDAAQIMDRQGLYVDLGNRPVMVVGDLHGDIISLEACLTKFQDFLSKNPEATLVFLGDYVDRGPNSVQILKTLAELKITFPDRVYLIRGNHEDTSSHVYNYYGLSDELLRTFPEEIPQTQTIPGELNSFFNALPVYITRGNYHFMHGCIPLRLLYSPYNYFPIVPNSHKGVLPIPKERIVSILKSEDTTAEISESVAGPLDKSELINQILWNDPTDLPTAKSGNRGNWASYTVPFSKIKEFVAKDNGIIVRAHSTEAFNKFLSPEIPLYNIFSSYFAFMNIPVISSPLRTKKGDPRLIIRPLTAAPVASVLEINSE